MTGADIAVYGPDGQLQLVVEIKNRPGASAEWATRLRHNLLVHSFIPRAPYFLLALPDFFYLWTDAMSASSLAKPDYKIKATKILAPYLDQLTQPLNGLSGYGFEMIMTSWLALYIQTFNQTKLIQISNGSLTLDYTKQLHAVLLRLKLQYDCVRRIKFRP